MREKNAPKKAPFDLDDLINCVREFVANEVVPYERRVLGGSHGPEEELLLALQEKARLASLLTPQLPADWGGYGLSHRETAAVFKAAGYSPIGPAALNVAAPDEGNMHLLAQVATEEQKLRFLKPLAAGECRSAFLMTEPADTNGAGSDPGMLKTQAVQVDGGWKIDGGKTFATGADGARFAIVMARTAEAATMFLVGMDLPGVRIERLIDTIDGSMVGGHAVVTLENVIVPSTNILGALDEGFRFAQVRLAPARLTHCMRWWGLARRCQDIASEYATKRQAFGKPLIDHEGVGFMLADNEIQLKQAELMIDWCAGVLDAGATGTSESSMTKVAVSEALYGVTDRCVQIMGGTGVSGDTIVELAFRELRAFRIYDGPSEVHRWSLAQKIKRETLQRNTMFGTISC